MEHVANPIKALIEWRRVLIEDGFLILVLPNKESNFDHFRPFTSIEHLVDDFVSDTDESDLTHLPEILLLLDLKLDTAAGTFECFEKRAYANFAIRSMHHHVFDLKLIEAMLHYSGFLISHSTKTTRDFFIFQSLLMTFNI